ncbi:uncharacterized protein [Cicer arietinum]|uniref:uncharacterized protein n=1 Tax=Cicer arietinum TaxID=3827 RepID=UPI00032A9FB1
MIDAGLIYAFLERWHRETNSFHMSFGEMTITMDGVTTLRHIPPCGKFLDAPINMNTNKIYEHYPNIYKRSDSGTNLAHIPRAYGWTAKHVVEVGLLTYQRRLNVILLDDVLFTPYNDDRTNHLFEAMSMFSGYLRWGEVSIPYLPERCLRQFGHIQCILHDVPRVPDIDWEWQNTMRACITIFWSLCPLVMFFVEVSMDYYIWCLNVSHPLILSDAPLASPPTVVQVPSSSAQVGPSSTHDRKAYELLRRAIRMVNPMGEVHEILSELICMFSRDY